MTPVHADQRAVLLEDFEQHERRSQIVGFDKTLEMYPQDPWSREGLAACYLGLGKPADAVRLLEERLKLGPTEVHSLVMLGMACSAAGDFDRAEQLAAPGARHGCRLSAGLVGFGQSARRAEKERRCGQCVPPRVGTCARARGRTSEPGQRAPCSKAIWTKPPRPVKSAVENSPDDANYLLKLAEIRTREKRYDESLQLLANAQRLAPYTHPPKVLLAVYCFQSGETDRARKLLAEAHAEQPDHPVPALFLGQLARQEQQGDAAHRYLDAAASLPLPDNWPESHRKRFLILLHSERLQLAQQLQDEELARDALAKWIKCEPENEKLRELYKQLEQVTAP